MLFIPDTVHTLVLSSIIYIFKRERKAETINEVLNYNAAPGCVSERRGFEVGVNC